MKIVFLTHRLPYAPNRGDRVRAYHELRALAAAGHHVHVVSLVHDQEEAAHASDLTGIAASVRVAHVPRRSNLLRAVPRLAGNRPLTHMLLDSQEIQPALRAVMEAVRPDLTLAYCSSMARFAMEEPLGGIPFLLDMVDVDSAKWAAMAKSTRFPLSWVYAHEARVLSAFEAEATRRARMTYVVNQREVQTLRALAGPTARLEAMENGVDVIHLRPENPPADSNDVVFCGVMNYAPNENGAVWLAEQIWPAVRAARPDARLILVGSDPTGRVKALAGMDRSIHVTGSVPDVRPYLWSGAVAAAPLLIARGVQNKVLEAVAAGLPSVVTPIVAEGLPPEVMPACRIADGTAEFSRLLLEVLAMTPAARRQLAGSASLACLSWDQRLSPLLNRVEQLVLAR